MARATLAEVNLEFVESCNSYPVTFVSFFHANLIVWREGELYFVKVFVAGYTVIVTVFFAVPYCEVLAALIVILAVPIPFM